MATFTQLSRNQWLYLFGVLLVLPLVVLFVNITVIADWYVLEVWAPALERDLGFHAGVGRHSVLGSPTFQILSVNPGGRFADAGIQPGDVPSRVEHGPGDFYAWLQHNRGKRASISLIRFEPNSIEGATGKQITVDVDIPGTTDRAEGDLSIWTRSVVLFFAA